MPAPEMSLIHVFRGAGTRIRSSACAMYVLSPPAVMVGSSASVAAVAKYTSLCEPWEWAITSMYRPAPVRLMV